MEAPWNRVYAGTGALYAASLAWYGKKFFRVNGNGVYFLAFAAFSVPASYGYAKFMLSNPETEAALMNNFREGVEE